MAPVLGYYKLRGLAQPIRLILVYTGTEFTEKDYDGKHRVDCPDAETAASKNCAKSDCWFREKFTLGLDFPNLPYLIDGDLKISESIAILRHIARKNGLAGEAEKEKIAIEILENVLVDLKSSLVKMCYNPNFENLKADFLKTLPNQLKQLSNYLGQKKWFTGDKLTYADFLAYETLDVLQLFSPTSFDSHPNLKKFLSEFESLEPIKKYIGSDKFIKNPINGPFAQWGNK